MPIIIQEGGWMASQRDILQFAQDSCCIHSGKEELWLGSLKPMESLEETYKRLLEE